MAVGDAPWCGFRATVDGRGLLLQGPQAKAVAARLKREGIVTGAVEVDARPTGLGRGSWGAKYD